MLSSSAVADEPIELWNRGAHVAIALDAILAMDRRRLTEVGHLPRTPGYYLVFYRRPDRSWSTIDPTLYASVDRGTYPLYVGSAVNLRERIGEHRKNTEAVASFSGGEDLFTAAVPLHSHADALYAEQLLLGALRCVWNEKFCQGWGSSWQGATRATQAPTPWSVLHPGRRTGLGTSRSTASELAHRVRDHLAQTVDLEICRSLT